MGSINVGCRMSPRLDYHDDFDHETFSTKVKIFGKKFILVKFKCELKVIFNILNFSSFD